MATHWIDRLEYLDACADAIKWAHGYGSLSAAWAACERADWMLWLASHVWGKRGSRAHRRTVLAACACARMALHCVSNGEDRPLGAIETVERWARGKATDNEIILAKAAAEDAWAIAEKGKAEWATVDAANAAAGNTEDVWVTAWDAAEAIDGAPGGDALRDMADMLRRDHYPEPPEIEIGSE